MSSQDGELGRRSWHHRAVLAVGGAVIAAAGLTGPAAAAALAGPTAGALAGSTAGALAGSTAGALAGPTAGALAGSTAGALAGSTAGALARPFGGLSMLGRAVVKIGDASELDGVFCLTTTNCWTVGFYTEDGAELNLALHWNGTKWSQVSVPSPGGTSNASSSGLDAVRCLSVVNCWAVGYYDKGTAQMSQALHWNGTKWRQVDTPDPGGSLAAGVSQLTDVTCSAPDDCWATGSYGQQDTTLPQVLANFVVHWNGKKWRLVSAPSPAGSARGDLNVIDAIRCTSASECWAVGTYGKIKNASLKLRNEILQWNGHSWSVHAAPNYSVGKSSYDVLEGLACTSASNCLAVGTTDTTDDLTNETLRWNGKHWRQVAVSSPHGAGELHAISCTSARNCWAVGDSEPATGGTSNEALHWSGNKWFVATMPQPSGTTIADIDELISVLCTDSSHCLAVGQYHTNATKEQGQILRFTGTKWVVRWPG